MRQLLVLALVAAALFGCTAPSPAVLAAPGAPALAVNMPAASPSSEDPVLEFFWRKKKKQAPPASGAKPGEVCGGKRGVACGKGLFCDFSGNGADACGAADRGGVCAEKPEICTFEFRPVCGCDGKTYGNDCARRAAGVSKASDGECGGKPATPPASGKEAKEGEMCGGFAGFRCAPGLFCDMTPADGLACGTPDRAGTCAAVPSICTRDFRPVCGCDGKTYGNDCTRRAAGVAKASEGECGGTGAGPALPGTPTPVAGPAIAVEGTFLWMSPKACKSNPWETAKGIPMPEMKYANKELAAIDGFFQTKKIKLLELGLVQFTEPQITCKSCNCARGDVLVVVANKSDVDALKKDYGFQELDAGWMQTNPTACESNPWSKTTGADEGAKVSSYLKGTGVVVEQVGFLSATAPRIVCTACTCPRGDRLLIKSKAGTTLPKGFVAAP